MLLNFGIRDGLTGMPYVQTAVSAEVGTWGIHFITISIILFAFSSLIGNYCYAESNLKFIINDKKALLVFRLLTVAVIFFGAQADFSTIWDLADVLIDVYKRQGPTSMEAVSYTHLYRIQNIIRILHLQ